MITFPKVKAASYAICKRLQGYHLLQNPSGTSQAEVNMIKEKFYGTTPQWDDIFHIERIKKVYTKNSSEKESKFLMSMHFFDIKKMQMIKPRKKDISLSIHQNGKFINLAERNDLAWEQIDKRSISKLSFIRSNFLVRDSEYDNMYRTKRNAQWDRGYYKTHYSFLNKIISLGMHKRMLYPTEHRPNFFKVLYKNLTNKI